VYLYLRSSSGINWTNNRIIIYWLVFTDCRYIDEVFLAWNRSEHELCKLLNEANQWYPNIKLEYTISQSLPFLDVLLTNTNGILLTSTYHKPSAEPYVVPFISDHHPHVFRNIIKTMFTRTIRYSSTIELFEQERRFIKLMLLYNGYVTLKKCNILKR